MKVLGAIAMAAAVYGGVHILRVEADAPPSRPASVAGVYRLVANGGQGCTVKRQQTTTILSALSVDPRCGELLPGLERAKFWRSNEDGTVSLSENGIDPIVVFAAADGEGYESYQPALPLLSMAAE